MAINKKNGQNDDDSQDFLYTPLSRQQLQELHLEVIKAGSWSKFLYTIPLEVVNADGSKRFVHIVKLDEHGQISSIIQSPATGKRIYPGWEIFYSNDIPYSTWQRVYSEYDKYTYGLEQQMFRENPELRSQKAEASRKYLQETLGLKIS